MFTAVEQQRGSNDLIDEVVRSLTDVGITVTRRRRADDGATSDELLTLDAGPHGRTTYLTVAKLGAVDRRLATAWSLPSHRPLLLVARHIPDPVADVLRARGVDHADAAGNVHLSWSGLRIDVSGRRPRMSPPPRVPDTTAARAFTRSGTKVVFALLSWSDLAARPVREIATTSGVSVGTVHTVVHELTAAGYLREGTSGRTLNRGGELLDRWAEAYTVTLSRKLPIASFVLPDADRAGELETDLLAEGAQLGGELAAHRVDPHLHPASATFYVERLPAAVVAKYRMRPDTGTVHLRKRFWTRLDDTSPLVPSPLVYADLVSSGDPRQREHAERIRGADDRLVELDRS